MPDLLRGAVQLALDAARQLAATTDTITYSRNGQSDLTLTGKVGIGESEFELLQDQEIIDLHRRLDFFIHPKHLDFGAGRVTPAEGDRITLVEQTTPSTTTTRVYEVTAPPPEQPWRWSDRYNTQFRIHTKLISTT